ncbi:Ger(x)C family spore germination protein [Paenibacillus sp. NPDC058910]|uniref:Ger(x)C family spore germination protein n=1 Tax=unclassified Paenibacillus TaxID=185978 RepID=UPI0036A8F090
MSFFQTVDDYAAVLGCTLLLALIGCGNDKTNLEDATVPLALGLDVIDERLHYYISAPVFTRDIQKKSRGGEGIAEGLRQSRNQQDAQFPGAVSGRNYQVIIVGKKLLQYKDWFKVLDVKFRDPRNTVTDRIIAYDGPVTDVIHFQAKDQPPTSVFLRGLIDSGSRRSTTVKTTEQELHRQLHDRAITPSISEIMIENGKILLKGTALLSQKGQYRDSLSYQETSLLQILKKDAKPGISLTIPVEGIREQLPFNTDLVSFSISDVSVKIKTSHEDGRFQYKIKINSFISITEKFLDYELLGNSEEMANKLSKEMKKSIEKLIHKFQHHKIDPVGFGLYARAYHYPLYKAAQDNWGEELSRARFQVEVDLRIGATGAVE